MQPAVPPPVSHARPPAGAPVRASAPAERDRLIARARALAGLGVAYMAVEGTVGTAAALGAGSTALLAFGLGSAIECLAGAAVLWRFSGARRQSEAAERRAGRLVAASLLLLAAFVAQDAARGLAGGSRPAASRVGIGLAIASIVVMPMLARAKRRVGARLGSSATSGDGAQNMLCALTAAGALAGLALNAAFGLWWADAAAALCIAALAAVEGVRTWRGEGCSCVEGIDGISSTIDAIDTRGGRCGDACGCEAAPAPAAPLPA